MHIVSTLKGASRAETTTRAEPIARSGEVTLKVSMAQIRQRCQTIPRGRKLSEINLPLILIKLSVLMAPDRKSSKTKTGRIRFLTAWRTATKSMRNCYLNQNQYSSLKLTLETFSLPDSNSPRLTAPRSEAILTRAQLCSTKCTETEMLRPTQSPLSLGSRRELASRTRTSIPA